jgi:hypothetical protein
MTRIGKCCFPEREKYNSHLCMTIIFINNNIAYTTNTWYCSVAVKVANTIFIVWFDQTGGPNP